MWTCASILLDLQSAAPSRRALLRAASSLTLVLVVAVLCVLVVSILLLRRHRRTMVGFSNRRKRRHRSDPWFESARRVTRDDVAPRATSEHDTVDLDPSELSEADVDQGFDDEPPDQGWDNDIGPEESRGPQVFGDGLDDPPTRPPRKPPPRPKRPSGGGSPPGTSGEPPSTPPSKGPGNP